VSVLQIRLRDVSNKAALLPWVLVEAYILWGPLRVRWVLCHSVLVHHHFPWMSTQIPFLLRINILSTNITWNYRASVFVCQSDSFVVVCVLLIPPPPLSLLDHRTKRLSCGGVVIAIKWENRSCEWTPCRVVIGGKSIEFLLGISGEQKCFYVPFSSFLWPKSV